MGSVLSVVGAIITAGNQGMANSEKLLVAINDFND